MPCMFEVYRNCNGNVTMAFRYENFIHIIYYTGEITN